ncbi:MAG TPA: glycoside hydrolase family 18 protein [Rhabdochlamydiaceae bacterium]|nr:glycoside hydrolase family 18 protein [Rhabdochlamydiaceae bacterium]
MRFAYINILLGLVSSSLVAQIPEYESYLESWDSSYKTVFQNLNIRSGVVINVAFGDFTFSNNSTFIGGLEFSSSALKGVISYVHSRQGQVKLSLGGATYPLQNILKSMGPRHLASSVAACVAYYNLDGVDLDIEDNPNPQQEITFIQQLRQNLGSGKIITLTVPGQDWNGTPATVIPAVKNAVNFYNFMEYDIWIDPNLGMIGTIQSDIATYQTRWGLSPGQIQLGLMPGNDDEGHYLSVQDAQNLAAWAKQQGLAGVMTWDLDRDYKGQTGQGPFTYSIDIMNVLFGQ